MRSSTTADQVGHATEVEQENAVTGANDSGPTFEAHIKSLFRERDRADSGTPQQRNERPPARMSDVIIGLDGRTRCAWAGTNDTPLVRYHDKVRAVRVPQLADHWRPDRRTASAGRRRHEG